MFRSDLTNEGLAALEKLLAPLLRDGLDHIEYADRLRLDLVDEDDCGSFILPAKDAIDGREHKLRLEEKDFFFWSNPEGCEPRGWES